MKVHVTEVMNFMRCPRQWDYSSPNRQSLSNALTAPHFVLGSCIHEALAEWLVAPEGDLTELYLESSAKYMALAISDYTALVGAKPSPAELLPLFEALNLGKSMMINYQTHWKTPIDFKHYHVVEPEQTIVIPIPGSYGSCDRCGGLGCYLGNSDNSVVCITCGGSGNVQNQLEGTLDGIIADARDRLLILEHKTYNAKPNRMSLEMNFQFVAYQWLLTKMDIGPVLGLAYDGMWKRDGEKQKDLGELFFRDILTRNKHEVFEFEQFLSHVVTVMSNDPLIYPSVPWKGCFDCSYIQLCKAQSRNDNYISLKSSRYIKRVITNDINL